MFSPGATNILALLNPGRRPRGSSCFPRAWKNHNGKGRIGKSESIRDWFVRCVDNILECDIQSCQSEENLAFFAVVKWTKKEVYFANCQALIVHGGSLEEFYDGKCDDCQYHRLDLDMNQPGPLFKEPLPHIHSRPQRAPRFPGDRISADNIVVDFLEFIYRNYQYDKWMSWVRKTWEKEAGKGVDDDTLSVIAEAFETGHIIPGFNHFKEDLELLKRLLRKEKHELYPSLRIQSDILKTLNYDL